MSELSLTKNVENKDDIEQSANKNLLTAIKASNIEDINNAINSGADINTTELNIPHPLFHALDNNNQVSSCEIFQYLLKQKNININPKDKDGSSLLAIAAAKGNLDILVILLRIEDPNIKSATGEALFAACEYGQENSVLLILNHVKKIAINFQNRTSDNNCFDTPLIQATRLGYKKIIEYLLAYGANINTENNHNDTALMLAIKTYTKQQDPIYLEIIELLVHTGASLKNTKALAMQATEPKHIHDAINKGIEEFNERLQKINNNLKGSNENFTELTSGHVKLFRHLPEIKNNNEIRQQINIMYYSYRLNTVNIYNTKPETTPCLPSNKMCRLL